MKGKLHPFIWVIIISIPFVLWAKLLILPAFDDWFTLSSPNYDPNFAQYFLPNGSFWRPFDAAIGYLYGWIGYKWFPTLSHILIFMAHLGSTLLVYKICANLGFNHLSRAITAVFFYMSPCVLATVMACDSLNQSYSHFWGMLSIWFYFNSKGRLKHFLWLGCIVFAVLSKENGLAWAIIPPILAFGFEKIDRKTCIKHISYGILLAMGYAIIRLSLPLTENYSEEYHSLFDISRKIKAFAILICYTWLPGDYIYLFHAPSRNILLFLLTLIPTLPFIGILFFRNRKRLINRQFLTLAFCAFIAASPNLLITMSMMNAYAWLGLAALVVGWCVNGIIDKKILSTFFVLYLLATTYTYVHHWYSTWQTSLPSHEMAIEAIEKTGRRIDKVYVITIQEQESKYSSFCTLPSEAFGWGRAVLLETGYQWPTVFGDTIIDYNSNQNIIDSIVYHALDKNYDCIWIVKNNHVEVKKP
jgi:hypothetical protein